MRSYINRNYNLTTPQLQRQLMEAGISDFDYFMALQKAEDYREAIRLRLESGASKLKVSVDQYISFFIIHEN